MSGRSSALVRRITAELDEIERVARHVEKDWQNYLRTGDDGHLKATAFDLHGFYTGLERVFRLIAEILDGHLPSGEGWHKLLLNQMAQEFRNVRPAVISEATLDLLEEYLRFRHLVRNVYSFNLVPEKLKLLVERLPTAFSQARLDVADFLRFFLEKTADPLGNSLPN